MLVVQLLLSRHRKKDLHLIISWGLSVQCSATVCPFLDQFSVANMPFSLGSHAPAQLGCIHGCNGWMHFCWWILCQTLQEPRTKKRLWWCSSFCFVGQRKIQWRVTFVLVAEQKVRDKPKVLAECVAAVATLQIPGTVNLKNVFIFYLFIYLTWTSQKHRTHQMHCLF